MSSSQRSIAGVPSSRALPGYSITEPPHVSVPDVIGALAVWRQNKTTKQFPPIILLGTFLMYLEGSSLAYHNFKKKLCTYLLRNQAEVTFSLPVSHTPSLLGRFMNLLFGLDLFSHVGNLIF